MNVHFIAIGGSAMHNLAIALKQKAYNVSGSDDEIFEPSKSRLQKLGLLPKEIGWNPDNIHSGLDAVILGMHARLDNPELIKAQELGIKIYSYPEYLFEQSKDKIRIVIGGSHGKTTITAMILHVFQFNNIDTDYMVGAKLDGFDVMVKLTENARFMVIEGDEYLTSPIDRRPKFHLYNPHIALLSGIAWDHINVFPTFEIYVDQFRQFIQKIEPNGSLIYCCEDEHLRKLTDEKLRKDVKLLPYCVPQFSIDNQGNTHLLHKGDVKLKVFGEHNLMNIMGAWNVCKEIGITDTEFFNAIKEFKGASNRLELVAENENTKVFKDFAHSPSKLKATSQAVKRQFTTRRLVACMELHTFSSLTAEFLLQYDGCMNEPDISIVYFNPHTIEHKKLAIITEEDVKNAFNKSDLLVFTDSKKLQSYLMSIDYTDKNLLLMSSGNFDGININEFGKQIISK